MSESWKSLSAGSIRARMVSAIEMATAALSAIVLIVTAASMAFAQAGSPCSGSTCGLGGQIRSQIGHGLPLPVTFSQAQFGSGSLATAGPFTGITIKTPTDHLLSQRDFVGAGLGQAGQIKPGPSATIQQGSTTSGPRSLELAPGAFNYVGFSGMSVGIVGFAVQPLNVFTNFSFDWPHPGTTPMGASAFTSSGGAIPTPNANVFAAGGREGAAIVSYYQGASGNGTAGSNFGATALITPNAGSASGANPPINGVVRFTATANQFGGQVIGRTHGTGKVRFVLGAVPALPCKVTATPLEGTTALGTFVPFNTGSSCAFALSVIDRENSDATVEIVGGAFGGHSYVDPFTTPSGIYTGTIGFNGTILGTGAPITISGMGFPFVGQGHDSVGFPATTGMLTIHVNDVVGSTSERFVRTGIDARDANGNGVVSLVTGSMTARDISAGNSNPTWITLEIPEPNAMMSAAVGLLALVGCHRYVRRREKGA